MIRSLWTSATGMIAQQLNIDVIANNLANVNTSGFKKSRPEFEDLLYQTQQAAGGPTPQGGTVPTGMQVGMGVRTASVHKVFTQGDYQNTGNPLDLAIEGDGFFEVDMNGVQAYTRAGSFKLNEDGVITTNSGHALQPEFSVPAETKNIVVNQQGHISALDAAGNEIAAADIPVFTFINPAGLNSIGRNLYLPTEASGDAEQGIPGNDNVGTVGQGFLEMSNVQLVDEMVNMIVGQRAFEINSKSIKTSDEMLQIANQLKR
ncbi:MAG: flagellar basal-body rod protein FlgG [Desulfovibrionales bacterium]